MDESGGEAAMTEFDRWALMVDVNREWHREVAEKAKEAARMGEPGQCPGGPRGRRGVAGVDGDNSKGARMPMDKPNEEAVARYSRVQVELAEARKDFNEGQRKVNKIIMKARRDRDKLDQIVPGLADIEISEIRKVDARAERGMARLEQACTPEIGPSMYLDENWIQMCLDMLRSANESIDGFESNSKAVREAWGIAW